MRVIGCKDGIQWIVQRRRCADGWTGMSFCRTRDALIRFARLRITPNGEWPYRELPRDALAVLEALPERHSAYAESDQEKPNKTNGTVSANAEGAGG